MTLKDLPIGKTATVTTVGGEGALRQHFLDMGLIPKADVTMVKFAPMGDPVEVRIHGYELTLRLADAEKIEIDKIRDTITEPMRPQDARPIFHPGLGEGGKYHVQTGEPLPPGETLTFALAGNQNCGKTTLFNQLTGSNQHVGNFPGVSRTCRAFTPCRHTRARSSSRGASFWMSTRAASSTLWTRRT